MGLAVPTFDLHPELQALQHLGQMVVDVGDAFRALGRFAVYLLAGSVRQPDAESTAVAIWLPTTALGEQPNSVLKA